MKRVTKCRRCKTKIPPQTGGGRPKKYCSASCRQAAYRRRMADPHAHAKSLFARDLHKAADGSGRVRVHVRALEELGYDVKLTPNSTRVKGAAQDTDSLIARLKTNPPRDK